MPYGTAWRVRRRAFHIVNLEDQIVDSQAGQLADAHVLLQRLVDAPADFVDAPADFVAKCRWFTGASILRSTYGVHVKNRDDPLLTVSQDYARRAALATLPGRWLADFVPWLCLIPPWMPGAGFARFAADTRAMGVLAREHPWAAMEAAQARGTVQPSMATRLLAHLGDQPDARQIAQDAAGQSFEAGVDTTLGAVLNMIYALVRHPDAQARARAELDAVVGGTRLPDFGDRARLPYMNALISESLRWKVVAPLGLPHLTLADDEYRGYYIPAGCIVMANAWSAFRLPVTEPFLSRFHKAILHDPASYPEPERFNPERFLRTAKDDTCALDPAVLDPRAAAFGFGRRVCPGRAIAEDVLFAATAAVLATLNIAAPADGAPMNETWQEGGLLNSFEGFSCTIRPRDEHAARLICEATGEVA